MKTPDTRPHDPRRVEDRRLPAQDKTPDAGSKERTVTRFVDPFDMRAEPQPEEPGYGHGV